MPSTFIRDARRATWSLLGLIFAGLLAIAAIGWFFQRLIDDVDRQLTNERVHLFIGEQMVLNVQYAELLAFKLAPAGKAAIYEQLLGQLDAAADQLNDYMGVMQKGGQARDSVALQAMGTGGPLRSLTYVAGAPSKMQRMGHNMTEMSAQLKSMARELVERLNERDRCFSAELPCTADATRRVREYFRELPPFFKDLNHQANEHRSAIVARLEGLEADLRQRQAMLRYLQIGFIGLVSASLMMFALFFTRRINAAQAQLLEAREAAEAASVAKTQFLATMSHEIRTPMSGVLGMIRLLRETRLDPEQRELARDAATSAESLLQVINDILDLSKIEAGSMHYERQPFGVRSVIDTAVSANRASAQQKSLDLRVDIANDAAGTVLGDSLRIRQVLLNLVGNAVKFTERGEVRLVVSRKGDSLRFEVSDTGIGIPESARHRLFTSFSQVDTSTTRRFGGSGLGLVISRQLVEGMGGHIDFSSTPGQGSCFWFELPLPGCEMVAPDVEVLSSERFAALAQPQAQAQARVTEGHGQGDARLLLVEDNLINQKLATTLLSRLGYTVDLAENGQQALDAVQRQDYAAVLMDIQMPQMDGIHATEAIRTLGGPYVSLPIIAITANAMQSDREACLAAGMNDFVSKPFDRGDLVDCLGRWVQAPAQRA